MEVAVIRYSPAEQDRWNAFVKNAKNSVFLFDRNYMDYHSDRFVDHSLLFFRKDELVAVFPANEKNGTLFSHGGLTYGGFILGNSSRQVAVNDCVEALAAYACQNGIRRIIIKPIPHIFHLQPSEEEIYALHRTGARLTEVSTSTVVNLKSPF